MRRTKKAQSKFDARFDPIEISLKEYHALRSIHIRRLSDKNMRVKLVGKGLITSHIRAKAILTTRGQATLQAGRPAEKINEAVGTVKKSQSQLIRHVIEQFGFPREYITYNNPRKRTGCWG